MDKIKESRLLVGKGENARGVFPAGGQTNEFLQLNGDLICLPLF